MTERENLPAKLAGQGLVVSTEKRGNLVARGMAAVNDMKQLTAEPDAEKLFKLGMHYFHGGEYGMPSDIEKAYEYLLKAAKLDHAEGQYELSNLIGEHREYIENWDGTEPVQWLESSAILGFGPAQYEFASDYELPEVEYEKWIEKAFAWYEERALAGDAEKQFEFATIHLNGDVNVANRTDGLRWLKAAAEQDHRAACRRLGYEYLRAKVTEHTTKQGIYWLSHAADLGDAVACVDLAEMYLCGHRGGTYSREPQSKLVEIDLQTAVYWYERGIQLGWSTAAYKLGSEYLYGKHLPQNLALAEKWLLHSANAGNHSAPLVLGEEYASGLNLRQDVDASIHWLELAAEYAKNAGLKLADIYLEGKIIPKNFEEAIKWLTHAADSRTFRNEAMKIVAEKCFDGRFTVAEESAAQAWLEKMAARAIETVADSNINIAAINARYLGELYELGLGVEKDMEKAIYWYRQSAEQGSRRAQARLHELGIDWEAP